MNAALKNCSNSIKIRHTQNAKERLETAHRVMGISNKLSQQLESIFNQWTKVRITDQQVRKLIEHAMAPSKEVLQSLNTGNSKALSSYFTKMCDTAFEYALTNPSQQMQTTRGTLFGTYNAITGYFQNARNYKDEEAKLKSIFFGGAAQARSQSAFHLCEVFARHGELELN